MPFFCLLDGVRLSRIKRFTYLLTYFLTNTAAIIAYLKLACFMFIIESVLLWFSVYTRMLFIYNCVAVS